MFSFPTREKFPDRVTNYPGLYMHGLAVLNPESLMQSGMMRYSILSNFKSLTLTMLVPT